MSWQEIASELPGGQSIASCKSRYRNLLAHHKKLLPAELGGEGSNSNKNTHTSDSDHDGTVGTSSYSYNNNNNPMLTKDTIADKEEEEEESQSGDIDEQLERMARRCIEKEEMKKKGENTMMRVKSGKGWKKEEEEKLWQLAEDKTMTWREIGTIMGRSGLSCQGKYKELVKQQQ